MSLSKAIKYGKEYRVGYGTKNQPFCKSVDVCCRNHGGRSGGNRKQYIWCLRNRTAKNVFKKKLAEEEIKYFKKSIII